MKIVFAGTPAFSVVALDALHVAGHEIVGVYTQPDRPAGRGQKLTASPVAERAAALALRTFKPVSFKKESEAIEQLRQLQAELMVVVAYGLILPQAVLDIPPRGCLNIHASLLPRWRGAAPIQRAILAGDAETGTTIMQMDAGLDTGAMLLREALPIGEQTAGELHDALAAQGARLVVAALTQLQAGRLTATPQPAEGGSYAPKLTKEEARIDWSLSATEIARRIRAYNPVPVAWCNLAGERLKVYRAMAVDGSGLPGHVLRADAAGLDIATGQGVLRILELQRPGGRAQAAAQLCQHWNPVGERCE